MRTIGIAMFLVALTALGGCAAMSEQACLATDWRTVGFEDGIAGRSPSTIGNYRQACADYGIAPDLAEYRAGHEDGVGIFCRAGNGFDFGRRGGRYTGICPTGLEPGFLAAYNEGYRLYELEAALRSVENQIAARERRTEELAALLASTGIEIVSDETPATRRAELMLNMAAMAKEQGRLGEEIETLRVERVLRESELRAYRQTLAFAAL